MEFSDTQKILVIQQVETRNNWKLKHQITNLCNTYLLNNMVLMQSIMRLVLLSSSSNSAALLRSHSAMSMAAREQDHAVKLLTSRWSFRCTAPRDWLKLPRFYSKRLLWLLKWQKNATVWLVNFKLNLWGRNHHSHWLQLQTVHVTA